MAELTRQNQELTREIGLRRQCQEGHAEGQAQNQSRGTASQRVLHLEKEMNQMRKVIDEMRENMRRVNLVDDLVHRTDFLFVPSINSHPLPSKFKMPSLDSYDGTSNP